MIDGQIGGHGAVGLLGRRSVASHRGFGILGKEGLGMDAGGGLLIGCERGGSALAGPFLSLGTGRERKGKEGIVFWEGLAVLLGEAVVPTP